MTFAVHAATAGSYSIAYRYANATGAASTLTVGAQDAARTTISAPATVSFPNLGSSWATWGTVNASIGLVAGTNLITVARTVADSGAVNLNYIQLNT
ncbi:carbohydrate-binding protein [Streptacidiphilus sp. BW17]|uniref:carbohydrate-binding protein n=1 Tax=Streptacidiphilus sp. BW17 TaxID=3156274 RepID=UPI003512B509